MKSMKIGGIIGLIVLGIILIAVISLVRACNSGFGYQAGSGLGSLVDIGHEKYKAEYLKRYADTFFRLYPQYKVPNGDPSEYVATSYDFLDMTKFYFNSNPQETYFVQWEGTGFISVRFAYDYRTGQQVLENPRNKVFVSEKEKERMTNRLRFEILDRIDSIIAASKDKDSAIHVVHY